MKLYYLSQEEQDDWDSYDCMVVAAETEESAVRTSPSGFYEWSDERDAWMFTYSDGRREKEKRSDWANRLENIKVEYIGRAKPNTKAGVICASFNAG